MLNRTRRRNLGKALAYMAPAIGLCLAFTFIPFARAIWLSFFIVDRNTFSPKVFYGLQYYGRIFNLGPAALGGEYLRSVLTSLSFTLMVVPASMLSALALAYLASARLRKIGIFRTIFSSSVAISVASASVIWSLIFSPNTRLFSWLLEALGSKASGVLTDASLALPAMAAMTVWSNLGFNFIITLAGLQAISRDLIDSARIDGARRDQIFGRVILPLLGPSLLFILIITTISSLQAFTQFKVMIDSGGPDLSTNVFVFAIFTSFWSENNYGFASAMSIVLFFILLGLSWAQFKLDRRVHYQ